MEGNWLPHVSEGIPGLRVLDRQQQYYDHDSLVMLDFLSTVQCYEGGTEVQPLHRGEPLCLKNTSNLKVHLVPWKEELRV